MVTSSETNPLFFTRSVPETYMYLSIFGLCPFHNTLCMTPLWDVAEELFKDRYKLSHLSRLERSKFAPFLLFCHILSIYSKFLYFLAWSFPRMVLKRHIGWIALKVIFKVGKVMFGSFSHISVYKLVLFKCKYIASYSFSGLIILLLSNFNGYYLWQKGPIWTFVIYLLQYIRTVYVMTNVYM